jgi:hypothetical protein
VTSFARIDFGDLVRLQSRQDAPPIVQAVQLVFLSFLARLAIFYAFALEILDQIWFSTARTVASVCCCRHLDIDLFSQGPRTKDTRQVQKASHATFCMMMEYKVTPVMRALEPLPAEPHEARLLMCNVREHGHSASRTRGTQRDERFRTSVSATL